MHLYRHTTDESRVGPVSPLAYWRSGSHERALAFAVTSIVFGYFKVGRRNNILDVVDVETVGVKFQEALSSERQTDATLIASVRSRNARHVARRPLGDLGNLALQEHPHSRCDPCSRACLARLCQYCRRCSDRVQTCRKGIHCTCFNQKATSQVGDVFIRALQFVQLLSYAPCRLTLYDSSGKTGGVCAKAFDSIGTLLIRAADRVIECGCSDGCPRCMEILPSVYALSED
jgi:DEAD/DEAH box helicase domain-containing protein